MAEDRPVPLGKRIERKVAGWLLAFVVILFRLVPRRKLDGFGRWVGRVIRRLSGKYRRRTVANLRMVFPDWSEAEVQRVAMGVFEHFGKTMARFFGGGRETAEEILASVEFHGLDVVDRALEEGRGVMVITAHFGNWERMAQAACLRGYRLSVVARDANQERTTKVVNDVRKGHGIEVFSRGKAARELFRRLRDNQIIAMLVDQNSRHILVPFFGIPAGTTDGPGLVHLATGAPIVTVFAYERPDGTYHAEIRRLELPERTGDREEDVKGIMGAINDATERAVRRHPEQWLWMHDRWRWARELGLIPND